MPKTQEVIYQVQLLVTHGEAKFDQPLPGGLKTVTAKHGWVALDTFFEQLLMPEGDSNSSDNGKDQLPTIKEVKARVSRRKKQTDETKEEGRCSLDRAKTSFTFHQYNTLHRLQSQGCGVQLRLRPYEGQPSLMETDRHMNVQVFDDDDD